MGESGKVVTLPVFHPMRLARRLEPFDPSPTTAAAREKKIIVSGFTNGLRDALKLKKDTFEMRLVFKVPPPCRSAHGSVLHTVRRTSRPRLRRRPGPHWQTLLHELRSAALHKNRTRPRVSRPNYSLNGIKEGRR